MESKVYLSIIRQTKLRDWSPQPNRRLPLSQGRLRLFTLRLLWFSLFLQHGPPGLSIKSLVDLWIFNSDRIQNFRSAFERFWLSCLVFCPVQIQNLTDILMEKTKPLESPLLSLKAKRLPEDVLISLSQLLASAWACRDSVLQIL